MDSNRKSRGFIKGKLMPLYRGVKSSSSSSTVQYSSKVKPSQSSPAPAVAYSVGYVVNHQQQKQQQDYVISQQPMHQNVSFIVTSSSDNHNNNNNNIRKKLFGDESVDIKAASYISSVQERFMLERVNSETMKHQDSSIMQ